MLLNRCLCVGSFKVNFSKLTTNCIPVSSVQYETLESCSQRQYGNIEEADVCGKCALNIYIVYTLSSVLYATANHSAKVDCICGEHLKVQFLLSNYTLTSLV